MINKEHEELIKIIEDLANEINATQELKDKIKFELDITRGLKEREKET